LAKKIGILFPGQGAQYIGMGKSLYDNFQVAREIYDKASDILDINLKEICFEGSFSNLNHIENMLPSIYTASVAAFQVLQEEVNIESSFMAGHSLGEYAALTCSGAIDFKDALKLVQKRSIYAREWNKKQNGTMTIVEGLSTNEIEDICSIKSTTDCKAYVACYNNSTQSVICGHQTAIMSVEGEIIKRGGRVTPLLAGIAFHTPLMLEASTQLERDLDNVQLNKLNCQVISNVYARPYHNTEDIKEGLRLQMFHPVQWQSSIQYMVQEGVTDFIDIGPRNIVRSLLDKSSSYNIYSYHELGEREKLIKDFRKDSSSTLTKDQAELFVKACITIAICTKNNNDSTTEYQQLVIEPYIKLKALLHTGNTLKSIDLINTAVTYLFEIYEGKQVPIKERFLRINKLLDGLLLDYSIKRMVKERVESILITKVV